MNIYILKYFDFFILLKLIILDFNFLMLEGIRFRLDARFRELARMARKGRGVFRRRVFWELRLLKFFSRGSFRRILRKGTEVMLAAVKFLSFPKVRNNVHSK